MFGNFAAFLHDVCQLASPKRGRIRSIFSRIEVNSWSASCILSGCPATRWQCSTAWRRTFVWRLSEIFAVWCCGVDGKSSPQIILDLYWFIQFLEILRCIRGDLAQIDSPPKPLRMKSCLDNQKWKNKCHNSYKALLASSFKEPLSTPPLTTLEQVNWNTVKPTNHLADEKHQTKSIKSTGKSTKVLSESPWPRGAYQPVGDPRKNNCKLQTLHCA